MKVVVAGVLALGGCARWDDACIPSATWTVPVRWSDGEGLVNVQGQYAWNARGDGTSVLAIGPPLDPRTANEVVIAGRSVMPPALATIGADGTVLDAFSVPATVSGSAPIGVLIDPAGEITAQWTSQNGYSPCRVVHYDAGAPIWEVSQYPRCAPIAVGPDGAVAYVVTDTTTTLNVLERDGTARWTIALPDDANRIGFADARHLVIETAHGVVTLDATTGTIAATLPGYGFTANGDGVLVLRYETQTSARPELSLFGFDGAERWTRGDPLPASSIGLTATGRVLLAGKIPDGIAPTLHLRPGFDGVVVLDAATGDALAATETCPTFGFGAITATGVLALTSGPDITAYPVPGLR